MPKTDHIIAIPRRRLDAAGAEGFSVRIAGKIVKGFAVSRDGRYYAYLNRCRHLPVTLDLGDNRFFTHDGDYIQCHMHGAIYEIGTGLCVGGPCQGASLAAFPVEVEEDQIVVTVPRAAAE